MPILVTERIEGPALSALAERMRVVIEHDLWQRPDDLLQQLDGVRALVVRNQTRVDAQLLDRAENLEIIARAGAGFDNIDVSAASERGIVVAGAFEENAVSVAEHVFALMLALVRKIIPAHQSVCEGQWNRHAFCGTELHGKTLGIVGLGRIGTRVAMRAKAFGMRVWAADPLLTKSSLAVTESCARLVPLHNLLTSADIITVHLPLTADTTGLFDYDKFRRLKPTAVFINTSRGGVVKEADLIRALRKKILAGAALDVREQEPPKSSPLNELDNVVLTPHIGAFTEEAQEKVVECIARNVEHVLRGRPATDYVNFPRPCRPAPPQDAKEK